jgi:hypothetical protein
MRKLRHGMKMKVASTAASVAGATHCRELRRPGREKERRSTAHEKRIGARIRLLVDADLHRQQVDAQRHHGKDRVGDEAWPVAAEQDEEKRP